MILSQRSCLADICNAVGIMTAVEIGTHHAIFADQFMHRFRGSITLVDPWKDKDSLYPTFYPSFTDTCSSRDEDYRAARTIMEKYGERVEFMRTTSAEASLLFDDESVGFVYIDGLHYYENVSHDISLWYPKVKSGGIIAGHDYHNDYDGVIRSVEELRQQKQIQVFLTCEGMPSWWGVKP